VESGSDNEYILTLDMVMNNAIDPMIGMDNVTPEDFMNKQGQ
jgi:hypothetical protein